MVVGSFREFNIVLVVVRAGVVIGSLVVVRAGVVIGSLDMLWITVLGWLMVYSVEFLCDGWDSVGAFVFCFLATG